MVTFGGVLGLFTQERGEAELGALMGLGRNARGMRRRCDDDFTAFASCQCRAACRAPMDPPTRLRPTRPSLSHYLLTRADEEVTATSCHRGGMAEIRSFSSTWLARASANPARQGPKPGLAFENLNLSTG